jgi:hypothetical protein
MRRGLRMDVTLFDDGAKVVKFVDEDIKKGLEKLERVLNEKINMNAMFILENNECDSKKRHERSLIEK